MNGGFVIATDDLSKRYGRILAVDALNLRVGTQQITGFPLDRLRYCHLRGWHFDVSAPQR